MPRRLALWGLGGIGKTQIALTYAWMHFEQCQASVFWINARSNETIITDITRLCDVCHLTAKSDDEKVTAFKRFLTVDSPEDEWLLIFDNANHLDKAHLAQYFPTGQRGNILLTSRNRNVEGQVVEKAIEVAEMDVKDARSLFVARGSLGKLSDEEDAIVLDILNDLGCLPLMLEQAAAYIRATGVGLSKYRSYVKNKRDQIFKYPLHPSAGSEEYQRSVETTWTVSYEQIRIRSPDSAQLLLTLSFLDHSVIWEEVLEFACKRFAAIALGESREGLPEYLVNLFSDDGYNFDVAMEPLLTFSMVRRKEGKITIHPLVGQCARRWTASPERHVKETIRLVSAAFEYVSSRQDPRQQIQWWKISPQIQHCCNLSKQIDGTWKEIATPFVNMCKGACWFSSIKDRQIFLDSCEPFLDREKQPLLTLGHAEMLANLYTDTNRAEKAVRLLEDTMKWAKELKESSPQVNAQLGTLFIKLSDIMAVSGQVEQSHEIMHSWRPLDAQNPSPPEVVILGYRDRLWGRHLYLERRFAEAEKVLKPVLQRESLGGQNRAWVITHLADVLVAESKPEEIVPLIQAELAASEIRGSPPAVVLHISRLKINLGEALIELGRYSEAETLLSGLLVDLEQLGANEDGLLLPEVFFATSGLARISHSHKQWKSAVDRWQQALKLAETRGWTRRRRCANLVHLSLYDAAFNWGKKVGAGDSNEEIAGVLRLLEKQRHKPMLAEEPMFFHWEAFIVGSWEARLDLSKSPDS
jgi:tetratricopeptide (TPR) repeat protein